MIIPQNINFDPEKHCYYNDSSQIYTGTSHFLDRFKEPFNKEIAGYVAKKRVKEVEKIMKKTGRDQRAVLMGFPKYKRGLTMDDVLKEWDDNSKEATDAGTYVHDQIEHYLKFNVIKDPKFEGVCKYVLSLISHYSEYQSEAILSHDDYWRAGTCDIIAKRTSSKASIVDIFDFKTNYDNFSYDSTSIDQYTGEVKHNNRFFLDPVSHLEDSYYNKTCLQMSDYMWMAENYGYKPGRLNVILIDYKLNNDPVVVPMPYMKSEIESLINYRA